MTSPPPSATLPPGVVLSPLQPHADVRGALVEVFRSDWHPQFDARQWTVSHSRARTMRGVHVHVAHADYVVLLAGTMLAGLHDLREGSAGHSCLLTIEADTPQALLVPKGVCHGFYFAQASTLLYGMDAHWTPVGELGCRFDAPELGLSWPDPTPILSERDRVADSYAQMRAQYLDATREQCRSREGLAA